MVLEKFMNNNNMDSYKLLDLSGSDSENEIFNFAPIQEPQVQRKKRLKRY